jgi:hypothetical protein
LVLDLVRAPMGGVRGREPNCPFSQVGRGPRPDSESAHESADESGRWPLTSGLPLRRPHQELFALSAMIRASCRHEAKPLAGDSSCRSREAEERYACE